MQFVIVRIGTYPEGEKGFLLSSYIFLNVYENYIYLIFISKYIYVFLIYISMVSKIKFLGGL